MGVVLTRMSTFAVNPVIANHNTPTEASIDAMLDALMEDEHLKRAGIEVESWCGLMMGCCSMDFKMDACKAAELPDLMKLAQERMQAAIDEHVRYYADGTEVKGCCVAIMERV